MRLTKLTQFWLLAALAMLCSALVWAQSYYSLPNVNSGFPANARQIPWLAGSDLWNGGTLPNYAVGVTCSGMVSGGTTDNTSIINSCIASVGMNQAVLMPCGTFLYNGTIRLKSNMVLRGCGGPVNAGPQLPAANASATTLIPSSGGFLTTQPWSYNAGCSPVVAASLDPGTCYGQSTLPSTYQLSGSPQKGDTIVTIGSGSVTVGQWIIVLSNDDPSLIANQGQNGFCQWCGANTGSYILAQIVQVTGFASGTGGPGSVANISRPLYFTPYTASVSVTCPNGSGTCVEPVGAKYMKISLNTVKAGFENFRVDGSQNDTHSSQLLDFYGCLYCWAKGDETYKTGGNSLSAHIESDMSYGNEIRDNNVHDQNSGASGSGYGIYFQFVNSDHKVENNVVYHSRHGLINQGGNVGTVWLYNYVDDMYTDDGSYLASMRSVHGGHSLFNLWEGNIISHFVADDVSGTSSHHVLFRNWLWGGESNRTWNSGNLSAFTYAVAPLPPVNGFNAFDLYPCNSNYSLVNNVLGRNDPGIGGYWATWSAATVLGFNEFSSATSPTVYSLANVSTSPGYSGPGYCNGVPLASTSTIKQGNWDFKTNGIAYNDGGTGFSYQPSYYYSSSPSFISSAGCAWPGQGADLATKGSLQQPAYQRAISGACGGLSVATPTFSPAAGTYSSVQSVTISDTTPSSTIYYTTDGSTPTTSSTVYTTPVTISFSSTIKAIATASGFVQSAVGSATYSILPAAATPTFSPVAGTYTLIQNITISDTTPSSTIHYTTDGSTPTTSSTVYGGAITLNKNTTLKAIAVASGFANSAVGTAAYTINLPGLWNSLAGWDSCYIGHCGGGTPGGSGTPVSVQSQTIRNATPSLSGSSMLVVGMTANANNTNLLSSWFGADNDSATNCSYDVEIYPVSSSNLGAVEVDGCFVFSTGRNREYMFGGQFCQGSICLSGHTEYDIFDQGSGNWVTTSCPQTLNFGAWNHLSGSYHIVGNSEVYDTMILNGVTCNINTTLTSSVLPTGWASGTGFQFQLDASTPSGTQTYAMYLDSASFSSTTVPVTATPTFSPVAGTYTSTQTVTISDTTPSSTIYYTTDGSTPTTSSTVYTTPLTVSATTTVNAIATASGFSQSPVGSALYTISPTATPTFSPVAGTYTSTQSVTIASSTGGATVYYTTDGSTPTTSSTVYSTPVSIAATTTLKAIATAAGHSQSAVASGLYTINSPPPVTATPVLSPPTGTYFTTQSVTITDSTPSSTIYYTTDGSTPTTSSAMYSTPLSIGSTTTVKAIATAAGHSQSIVSSATYTINTPPLPPTLTGGVTILGGRTSH